MLKRLIALGFLGWFTSTVCYSQINWKIDISGNDPQGIAISPNGNIIVLTRDGVLSAYSDKGMMLWSKSLHRSKEFSIEIQSIACLESGNLCILAKPEVQSSEINGQILMLSPDGEQIWSFGSSVMSCSLAPDNKEIVGTDNQGIFSLNLEGKLNWKFRWIIPTEYVEACFQGKLVIIPDAPSYILALDRTNGSLVWKVVKMETTGPQCAPYGDSNIIIPFSNSLSLYNASGVQLWNHAFKEEGQICVWSKPTIANNGNILVGLEDEVIMLTSEGNPVWTAPITGQIRVPITVDKNDTSYVVAGHNVYAISSSGVVNNKFFSEAEVMRRVLIDRHGHLIIAGKINKLYSLSIE
jgi:outer membrane protein assembly factor BamB